MNTYEVCVLVTIKKWITVDANSPEEASAIVLENGIDLHCNDGEPEKYNEEVLAVELVK